MDCKTRLENYLRENGVPYSLHHHPPAFTAQAVAESEHVTGKAVAKVVIVFIGETMAMLALPASLRVNMEKAAGALGGAVRLAHEDEFQAAFPDCDVGAMPPFGNLYDLDTYVDKNLAGSTKEIVFNAGTHEDTIHLQYADFERLVHPRLAELAS